MKKTLRFVSLLFLSLALFVQCSRDKFDEDLLEGKWYNTTEELYFTFNADHNGLTDDGEGHGKQFTWSLDDDELSIRYKSEKGFLDGITEVYILTKLTSSRMEAYQFDAKDIKVVFEKK